MRSLTPLIALLALALAGCEPESGPAFPGSTEWDRNVVLAEAAEPVLQWYVAEGDRVHAGDLLLRLDPARYDARLKDMQGQLGAAQAQLTELRNGPRAETIARARADVDSAEAAVKLAELEYARVADLLARGLASQSSADQALAARDQRVAERGALRAALDELLAGTRAEEIQQAASRVDSIHAALENLRLSRERLDVRAPRDGRVDSLPFKPGDQPKAGDEVARLLVGERPIARVFVAVGARTGLEIGDRFELRVEGIDAPFSGTLRTIRSEPSFTPYYALTGDDASRLVYRTEILFDEERAAELPAGLPLTAIPQMLVATSD
jgi:HlyD family secretion protein